MECFLELSNRRCEIRTDRAVAVAHLCQQPGIGLARLVNLGRYTIVGRGELEQLFFINP